MNTYKYIINPLNRQAYCISSQIGRKILHKYLIQTGGAKSSTSKKRLRNDGLTVTIRKQTSDRKSIPITLSPNIEIVTFTVPGKNLYWYEAEFFWRFIYNFSEEINTKDLQNLNTNINSELQVRVYQNMVPEYNLTFHPSRLLGLFDTHNTEWFSKNIKGTNCNAYLCESIRMNEDTCNGCGPNLDGKLTKDTDNTSAPLSHLIDYIQQQYSGSQNIRIFLFCCSAIADPEIKQLLKDKKTKLTTLSDSYIGDVDAIEDVFISEIRDSPNLAAAKQPIQISILCHGELLFR